jgi:DNA adenine methylase
VIKWPGGKTYLAPKIVALMPPHLHYVEPYFGGGAVLFAKPFQEVSEVVNDIYGVLTNFWRVLQDQNAFLKFMRIIEATPFSEWEFEAAETLIVRGDLDIEAAVKFFTRCRQSRCGEMKDFATLTRNRLRRQRNEQASAWCSAIEGLPAVHQRLQRVVILNHDALEVIGQQDGDKTLFYCDPPYVHTTRAVDDLYEHEMTVPQHAELLDTLRAAKGKVLLSGYANELYDKALAGWNRHDFSIPNQMGSGKTKRKMVECVWANF